MISNGHAHKIHIYFPTKSMQRFSDIYTPLPYYYNPLPSSLNLIPSSRNLNFWIFPDGVFG